MKFTWGICCCCSRVSSGTEFRGPGLLVFKETNISFQISAEYILHHRKAGLCQPSVMEPRACYCLVWGYSEEPRELLKHQCWRTLLLKHNTHHTHNLHSWTRYFSLFPTRQWYVLIMPFWAHHISLNCAALRGFATKEPWQGHGYQCPCQAHQVYPLRVTTCFNQMYASMVSFQRLRTKMDVLTSIKATNITASFIFHKKEVPSQRIINAMLHYILNNKNEWPISSECHISGREDNLCG